MAILSTDVKAWYDMTNGSGTSLTDQSGNSNTGTLSGTTWLTTPKLAAFTNVIDLDGVDDYVTLGHNVNNQASFTVACWVYMDVNTGAQRFMHNGSSDTGPQFSMIQSAGTLIMRMISSTNVIQDINSTISTTTWTHLAISYNHGTGTFTAYKNGSSLGTSPALTLSANWSGTFVWLGRREGVANQFFNGKMQQVITLNGKAADATEIGTLYNSGAGVTYTGMFGGGGGAPATYDALFAFGGI